MELEDIETREREMSLFSLADPPERAAGEGVRAGVETVEREDGESETGADVEVGGGRTVWGDSGGGSGQEKRRRIGVIAAAVVVVVVVVTSAAATAKETDDMPRNVLRRVDPNRLREYSRILRVPRSNRLVGSGYRFKPSSPSV